MHVCTVNMQYTVHAVCLYSCMLIDSSLSSLWRGGWEGRGEGRRDGRGGEGWGGGIAWYTVHVCCWNLLSVHALKFSLDTHVQYRSDAT